MKKLLIKVNGKSYEVIVEETDEIGQDNTISQTSSGKNETIEAPMPGNIIKINFSVGENVNSGDTLMVLEAMKMENEILSPISGTVKSINVKEGGLVDTGELLAIVE